MFIDNLKRSVGQARHRQLRKHPACIVQDFVQVYPPIRPILRLIVTEKGKPVEKQGRKVSGLRGKTYDSGAARLVFGCSSIEDEGATMSIEQLFSALPPKPHPRRPERQFAAIRFLHSATFDSVVSTDCVDTADIVCLR